MKWLPQKCWPVCMMPRWISFIHINGAAIIWPTYYSGRSWNGGQNFAKVESHLKERVYPDAKYFNKQYDQLYSFLHNGGVAPFRGNKFERALAGRAPGIEVAEMNMAAPMQEKGKRTILRDGSWKDVGNVPWKQIAQQLWEIGILLFKNKSKNLTQFKSAKISMKPPSSFLI